MQVAGIAPTITAGFAVGDDGAPVFVCGGLDGGLEGVEEGAGFGEDVFGFGGG